jgi:hypothetical protein
MRLRALLGLPLGCAAVLAASAGCDAKDTDLYAASGGSVSHEAAGSSAGATAGSGAGGNAAAGSSSAGGSSAGGAGGSSSGSGSGGGSISHSEPCGGAQVLLVIQRSGAMFEEPDGDSKYWDMVQQAAAAPDGALAGYAEKLQLGALFFVRLNEDAGSSCPVVSSAAPQSGGLLPLTDLFDGNASAYAALAEQDTKMDAPVPEALAAAANMLSGNARHIVLITTAVPDTCSLSDSNCTVDPAIKAVQDAQQKGVTTHVIGLGNTDNLNAGDDQDGYQTYLGQLANAGVGKSVAMSQVFDEDCSNSHPSTAKYSVTSGDAHAYRADTAGDVKAALDEILSDICR